MKKIYLRAYCHGNLGDDLFIHIICSRYPDTDFYLKTKKKYSRNFEELSNLHIREANFIFKVIDYMYGRLFCRSFSERRIIQNCDASVLIGGSMFMQIPGKWERILAEYQWIRKISKHFFVVGANFGPFTDKCFLELYRKFFYSLDGVCFRDKYSYDCIQNGNSKLKDDFCIRKAADIAFLYQPEEFVNKTKMISLIPINLEVRAELAVFAKDYVESMARICNEAVHNGYKVNIISFCEEQGDEKVVHEIFDKEEIIAQKCTQLFFYHGDLDEVMNTLAQSEVVVSSRFHGMILGWINKCRVFPVVYDIKMSNYLTDLSYPGDYVSIDRIASLDFEQIVCSPLIDITDRKEEAKEQFHFLDTFLNSMS